MLKLKDETMDKLLDSAINSAITPSTVVFLLHLARLGRWPGRAVLAEQMKTSQHTISRYIRELSAVGLLKIRRNPRSIATVTLNGVELPSRSEP